jgi:hypothetical protein
MNTRTKKRCLPSTLAVLLSVFACSMGHQQISDLRTESRSVKLGDAKSVRVEIKMGAGELKVAGGAKELLEADFA